ncbi:SRPBCC domain-containing protein [Variovorax sp. J22P240]|uniref:SRPBCC domain-containing protein n=1 Tax=Variovorax sp. J22P240 TaxID=3053514 RepID=UPI002575A30E|nr:SRPBCC domain-containing protein [Variovorax sp. J22P240]MDM0001015.1 SRPBCC domain-containing protein [Variovorax sp. J22P240]
MKDIPSTHTDFIIEREFDATPEAVFQAWADPQAKRRWSDCHAEHTTGYRLDFRPFGHETHQVVYPDGRVQQIEKVFFDIESARRIVFAYGIQLDSRRLSVSLVTVEFFAHKHGTRMVYTEQLAYLDGHEDRAQRIRGTEESLDRLRLEITRPPRSPAGP